MATGTRPGPSSRRAQSLGAAMLMMGAGAVGPALAQQPQQQVELPAVTVTATEVNESPTGPVQGFVARRAVTATKTDTPLMETPQSITVITRDRMELQGAQSVQQAVGYTAGVTAAAFGVDNRGDSVKIRGADSTQYLDGLLNSVGFYNNTRPDPYALERIEVLKGPSGMLYGQGAVGGILNQVSKRPQAEAAREIGISYGNYQRKQIQADLTGPIDEEGKWLYRVVALGRDSNASIKHVKDDRYFIAPSLTYRPSASTSLTLLANFQKDDSGTMLGFLPWRGTLYGKPGGRIPQDFFVGEPGFDKYTAEQRSLGYQFEHAFNDTVTVRQNLRYTHSKVDYRSVYTAGFNGAGHGWVPGSDTLLRRTIYLNQPTLDQFVVDTQGQFKFATGALRHTLLAGIDYQRSKLAARRGVGGSAAPIDVYNPVYGNYTPPTSTVRVPDSHANQTGLYLQDQMEWNQWLLMLGLRHDSSRSSVDGTPSGSRDDSELSKRFGLMYRSAMGLNPYISYAESFQGVAGFNKANEAYKPLRGKQWEAGVKYQPPGENLTVTASVFDMIEKNRQVAGVVNGQADTVQVGEARTRGLELEAMASLGRMDLVATYTYLNPKITKGTAADQGQRLASIPSNMASLWANYRFSAFGVPGFLAGAGVRYNGHSFDGVGNNRVEGVTLYDAVLAYDRGPFRVALNVTNLFDKEYVGTCIARGDCFYGTRRTVVGSVTYRF